MCRWSRFIQNMVMLGAVLACDPTVSKEAVWAALPQVVKSRPELIEETLAAIRAQQSFRAADRISRDELHDRHAIS